MANDIRNGKSLIRREHETGRCRIISELLPTHIRGVLFSCGENADCPRHVASRRGNPELAGCVTKIGDSSGLAAVKFWSRKKFKGTAALKKKINPTPVPIEKKESIRWLENLRAVDRTARPT